MNDSTLSPISAYTLETPVNMFNVSMIDSEKMQATAARVAQMSPEQRFAWANAITSSIRDHVLIMAGKWFDFDEARIKALEVCQEAYAGRAWKELGYESWGEYWDDQFSDVRLFNTKNERNNLIQSLKENGFSNRMIAPMVNMTYQSVARLVPSSSANDTSENTVSESVQVSHNATPAHPAADSTSESSADSSSNIESTTNDAAPSLPTSTPAPQQPVEKIKSLDGKEYSIPRSHDALIADWMWLKSLKDMQGKSLRDIETETGIPFGTVGRILREGEPSGRELAALALKARRMREEDALSRGMVAQRMGLRLDAVEWLLDKDRDPSVRDVVDRSCLLDQAYGGKCRLIDGSEMRQVDIARLCGVSQSMVSQALDSLKRDYGLAAADRKRREDEGQPIYEIPVNATLADVSDHKAGQLEDMYQHKGVLVNGYYPDAGTGQWAALVDEEIMQFDPSRPETVTPYYTAFAACMTDLVDHLNGPFNMVLSHSAMLDAQTAKGFLKALEPFLTTLERTIPKLRDYVDNVNNLASLAFDDDELDDWNEE